MFHPHLLVIVYNLLMKKRSPRETQERLPRSNNSHQCCHLSHWGKMCNKTAKGWKAEQ